MVRLTYVQVPLEWILSGLFTCKSSSSGFCLVCSTPSAMVVLLVTENGGVAGDIDLWLDHSMSGDVAGDRAMRSSAVNFHH